MTSPELFVTNFNKNFTGVSATAANVVQAQTAKYDIRLVGHSLPHCPEPISRREACRLSRTLPPDRAFGIWHVRRNPEMRTAIWARDILRLPIKIVFTSAAQRLHSLYPRWLISRMDAVIATTPKASEFVPHVKAVVPHGVNTKLFFPPENRANAWQELGYGGKFGVATIGRIRPEKGTDLFVEAMIKLLPEHPTMTALVIGKAAPEHQSFKKKLEEQIALAGLTDRIVFTGEIAAEDMPKLMRALTLLVALPRYEGYGMTPLEALASGTPFIASDTGYFREFSCQGKLGQVVNLEVVGEAVQAIDSWLSQTDRLNSASLAAPDFIRQAHDISVEADAINRVYEELWSGET